MIFTSPSHECTKSAYNKSLKQIGKSLYQTPIIEGISSSSQKSSAYLKNIHIAFVDIENLIQELNTYLQSIHSIIYFSFNTQFEVIEANVKVENHVEIIRSITIHEFFNLSTNYKKFHGILFDKIS